METGTVDFVYALSVFTHLSEDLTKRWMREIVRILKPGGVFWFTAHTGIHHRSRLTQQELAKLDRSEFARIYSLHEGSQMFTGIHPPDCMRKIIHAHGIELLDHVPGGYKDRQDIWIVRKNG